MGNVPRPLAATTIPLHEADRQRSHRLENISPGRSDPLACHRRLFPDCRDHARHHHHGRQFPRTRARRRRAAAREHRAADGPAFRPAARGLHGNPARRRRADRALRRRLAGCLPRNAVDGGMARYAEAAAARLHGRRRRQHLRCRRRADQFLGKLARSQHPDRRPQLLQGLQVRLAVRTFQDRAGAGPLSAGLGDGRRLQGDRTERRIPGRRDPRDHADQFRNVLRVGDACAGRLDFDASSRRHVARPLSACRTT